MAPLFAPFRTGRGDDGDEGGWEDTPIYAPGRFHAHALSWDGHSPFSSSVASQSSASASASASGTHPLSPTARAFGRSATASPPPTSLKAAGRTTLTSSLPQSTTQPRMTRFWGGRNEGRVPVGTNLTVPDGTPRKLRKDKKGKGKGKAEVRTSQRPTPEIARDIQDGILSDRRLQWLEDPGSDSSSASSRPRLGLMSPPTWKRPAEHGLRPDDGLQAGPRKGFPQRRRRIASGAYGSSESALDGGSSSQWAVGRLLRPGRRTVEHWLAAWWKRWGVLVGVPCAVVWLWCAVPFPVKDPYREQPPWDIPLPWPGDGGVSTSTSLSSASISTKTTAASISLEIRTHPRSIPSTTIANATASIVKPVRKRSEHDLSTSAQQIHIDLADLQSSYLEPTVASIDVTRSILDYNHGRSGDEKDEDDDNLPVDANFYFFLFAYYGVYLAVALIFVTKLFDLYRLNWWPSSLGGFASYLFFWLLSLLIGFLLHRFDLDGLGRRSSSHRHRDKEQDTFDWERKTTWVLLAFFAMAMPALACFAKLRADRRQSYRRSLTAAQKTFLERQLFTRMPRSYKRFLWFVLNLALGLFALLIGQGFATVYLSTLPHNNVDGLVYVWTWIATCNILNTASNWILQRKVRSQALVFVFRFYYFLVYHVFYRNLFARLRSPDQAIFIQLLSSSFVIFWYPISMSKTFHRLLKWAVGYEGEWEEYAEGVGILLYLRNLSENVTMAAFLGWLTILHYGPNKAIYPFFAFETAGDPYNYRLTATASLIIWATELGSSFIARLVIWLAYEMDVTNLGLDEFRQHPELVVACVWTSIHVCMDMLLFLIKLNFR